ncbi:hypothetical protein BBJ28_00007230 [Nothophytophthora sp. Chile5]|nr:hypothetical protein BBJ28_00007230 [Nothophytophthora sp. Chile5]
MLVPVCVDAAAKEWSLLEFQGDVIAGAGSNPADMCGLDIGTLRFGEGGEITLRIGNHILSGKVAKLAKPFAVLQQHKQREGAAIEPDVDVDMEQASAQPDSGGEWPLSMQAERASKCGMKWSAWLGLV